MEHKSIRHHTWTREANACHLNYRWWDMDYKFFKKYHPWNGNYEETQALLKRWFGKGSRYQRAWLEDTLKKMPKDVYLFSMCIPNRLIPKGYLEKQQELGRTCDVCHDDPKPKPSWDGVRHPRRVYNIISYWCRPWVDAIFLIDELEWDEKRNDFIYWDEGFHYWDAFEGEPRSDDDPPDPEDADRDWEEFLCQRRRQDWMDEYGNGCMSYDPGPQWDGIEEEVRRYADFHDEYPLEDPTGAFNYWEGIEDDIEEDAITSDERGQDEDQDPLEKFDPFEEDDDADDEEGRSGLTEGDAAAER